MHVCMVMNTCIIRKRCAKGSNPHTHLFLALVKLCSEMVMFSVAYTTAASSLSVLYNLYIYTFSVYTGQTSLWETLLVLQQRPNFELLT